MATSHADDIRSAEIRQPTIRARVPRPMLDRVDEAARHAGMSRSALIRELLALGLAQRGLWPPASTSPEGAR